MKLHTAVTSLLLAITHNPIHTNAFVPIKSTRFSTSQIQTYKSVSTLASTVPEVNAESKEVDLSTFGDVNNLTFRELQAHCKQRGLEAVGNTRTLRLRLLENLGLCQDEEECTVLEDTDLSTPQGIEFTDDSDPDFDFNSLNNLILEKCEECHWKTATRKIKQLRRRYASAERPIPRETYLAVLECCMMDRLHGARASEPARKILEEMTEVGYEIPVEHGNDCVVDCIGLGPGGTHDGFGGIDPALAMLAAMQSGSPDGAQIIKTETFEAVVGALSRDGSLEEAILLIRAMVVDHCLTPSLGAFAAVAAVAARSDKVEEVESVLQLLSLAKAAGYVLDSIGSAGAGRDLLASGVIAAEKMDNLALGLRLLTAAGKAEGCAPDRGDDLVAASSAAAQRACTLIHKRAITSAVEDDNWKLAVKLLELMPKRSLTPSTAVWRKVLTVCAKAEKSRKATAILLDWVTLSTEGKAEKPPLSVFNTILNVCEICGEEGLTLKVLETMKQTHDIDGNIITFNIALKRLAKLGAVEACEGIIIGMLQNEVEPNVVSYTTAIGACAKEGAMDPQYASRWIDRMKSRNVMPNFHTYNTALASCLDGKLESTGIASKIASQMVEDVDKQLEIGYQGDANLKSVLPDTYTKSLAFGLMKQLRENWRAGDINMNVAKSTIRVPLLKLVDFNKAEAGEKMKKVIEESRAARLAKSQSEFVEDKTIDNEDEIEYAAINALHKQGSRVAEV